MLRLVCFMLVFPLGGLLAGCGSQGSYELHWSIACVTSEPTPCPVKTTKDCSDVGLDAVQVVAVAAGERTSSSFPCFGPKGAVGDGPGLAAGAASLQVAAFSPGGQQLAGPIALEITIPETGMVPVEVTLPRPPACNDGVDNDGDGLVDMMDPDCHAPTDTHE